MAAFVIAWISTALMRLFGQPLIDRLPGGDWGTDRLREAGAWAVSPASMFWFAAAATLIVVYWVGRRAAVTRATAINLMGWLLAGVAGGAMLSLFRAGISLPHVWADPALWLLGAAYVMPVLTAVVWWTVPEVIEVGRSRLRTKRTMVAD
ncbi:hypothetical protein [Microbacterium awajiense]|uniref:hypothetical protein n=1 Tax=Microbacterium awajiense TaxID=415214 RepID=UPI0031DBFF0D